MALAVRDAIETTISQFDNGADFRQFSAPRRFFQVETHTEGLKCAQQYMRQILSSIVSIQSQQHQLYSRAFYEWMERNHAKPAKRSSPVDPDQAGGYVVLHIDTTDPKRGYWIIPQLSQVLLWLLEFYLRPDHKLRGVLTSVSQIPAAVVPCLYPRNEHETRLWGPMRLHVLDAYLRSDAPDRNFWWDRLSRWVPNDVPELMMQFDAGCMTRYEDSITPLAMKQRAQMTVNIRELALNGKINPLTLISTLYIHLGYIISRLSSNVLRHAQHQLCPANAQDLMHRLFPLAVDMLTNSEIGAYHPQMLTLYELDDGILLRAISTAAEQVRDTLLRLPRAKSEKEQQYYRHSEHVIECFRKTVVMERSLSIHYDWRHKLLAEADKVKLPADTRWIHTGTVEHSFIEFLHESEQNLQFRESTQICNWLTNPGMRKWFKVDLLRLLYAQQLVDLMSHSDATREEIREEARLTVKHMQECNREIVVLRFTDPSVRYYDVYAGLLYLCTMYPEQMHRKEDYDYQTTARLNQNWISETCFAGTDCHGPYIVALRSQIEIIRQLQVLNMVQQPHWKRAKRVMPLYPLLCRFYLGEYDSTLKCDMNAIHVVVQTLASWMHLSTEHHGDEKTMIPRLGRVDVFDDAFPFLHIICDQIKRCYENKQQQSAYPDKASLNALADFLELDRPRRIRAQVLQRHIVRMRMNMHFHPALAPNTQKGLEMIRWTGFLERKVDHNEWINLDRPDQDPADFNWWFLYRPLIHNTMPVDHVRAMLLDGGMEQMGRAPIDPSALRDTRTSTGVYEVSTERLEPYLANYLSCFVAVPSAPATATGLRLKETFRAEVPMPSQALVEMIAYVEMLSSRESMAKLIQAHMYSKLDVHMLFDHGGAAAAAATKPATAAPGGYTMLPLMANAVGSDLGFDFYENTWILPTYSAADFARQTSVVDGKPTTSNEATVSATQASQKQLCGPMSVLMDMIMRFSDAVEVEACSMEIGKSFRLFEQQLAGWKTIGPDGKISIDRSKLPTRFKSASELLQFVTSVVDQPRQPIIRPPPSAPLEIPEKTARLTQEYIEHLEQKSKKRSAESPSTAAPPRKILTRSWDPQDPKRTPDAEELGIEYESDTFLAPISAMQQVIGGPNAMVNLHLRIAQSAGK
jgi:hypothetical protein